MTILVCKSQVQIISESCKADLTNFSDNCLDKVLLHSNLVKIAKQWIFSRKPELGSEHKNIRGEHRKRLRESVFFFNVNGLEL